MARALLGALQRGVKVNIYTKPNYRNTEALIDLLNNGAEIVGHERYHAKLIISDGNNGLVTTSNYTKKGLDEGFEVSVVLGAKDIRLIQDVIDYWDRECRWRLIPEVLLKNAPIKVKQFNPTMYDLNEFDIHESFSKEEMQYAPDSIDNILDYSMDTSRYDSLKKTEQILYKAVVIGLARCSSIIRSFVIFAIKNQKKSRKSGEFDMSPNYKGELFVLFQKEHLDEPDLEPIRIGEKPPNFQFEGEITFNGIKHNISTRHWQKKILAEQEAAYLALRAIRGNNIEYVMTDSSGHFKRHAVITYQSIPQFRTAVNVRIYCI